MAIMERQMDLLCEKLRKVIKQEIRSLLIEHSETFKEKGIVKERLDNPLYLENYGYKVYSQNEEDGIIEEIFNRIHLGNKLFVEFGIQTGLESNCHYLLHKGWSGLWIEGNKKDCDKCRELFEKPVGDGRLIVVNSFITKDNINSLIKENLCRKWKTREIDLLSIDIDGNDYHIWNTINCISPRVVVIEYNAKFPPNFEWVMEYDENHIWQGDDKMGASLKSYELLGGGIGVSIGWDELYWQ